MTTLATLTQNGVSTPFFGVNFSKEGVKQALLVSCPGSLKKKQVLSEVNSLNGFKPTPATMSISQIRS